MRKRVMIMTLKCVAAPRHVAQECRGLRTRFFLFNHRFVFPNRAGKPEVP
jgi:hypothetical protein